MRSNQTGVTYEFTWSQVVEAFIDPKTWMWVVLAILPNLGSALPSFFGPLILEGFGFDTYRTMLLNIPFGAVQGIVILASCWTANRMKVKGIILLGFMLPVVAGTAMLLGLKRGESQRPALLVAYYLTAFIFAANPLLMAWVLGNTGGATKTSTTFSLFQAGLSAGDMIGPLLFSANQAPEYLPGIAGVLGVFIAMILCVILQIGILVFLNKQQSKKRVRNGKSAGVIDRSMQRQINEDRKAEQIIVGDVISWDMTDRENDEFVYIY